MEHNNTLRTPPIALKCYCSFWGTPCIVLLELSPLYK